MAKTRKEKGEPRQGEKRIPIVEEELHVGKRMVDKGGVRVSTQVEEEPVEKNVKLREEKILVDRRPTDRPLTDEDRRMAREGVVEVTTKTEEPVVAKEAHVVGEVVVGKKVEEHDETIRDTVRKTRVNVVRGEGERMAAAERTGDGRERPGNGRDRVASARQPYRGAGQIPNDLRQLNELDEFELADDAPDPRGWDVEDMQGEEIGSIDYLLASPSTLKVYFAVVDAGGWTDHKRYAVPLAMMRLDTDDESAKVAIDRNRLSGAPEFRDGDRDYNRYDSYWRGA